MSTAIVQAQITKFLKSADPEVIAIRGAWGVGKTFSWKKFLGEAKEVGNIALDRYAYVSLFGVDSLDALRTAIFESTIHKRLIGTEATVESFAENYKWYAEKLGRKGLRIGKIGLEYLGIGTSGGSFLQAGSFLAANRIILCIDDLERRGGNLSVRDVLGLASFLKEEQHCKVAFLLNDGEEGTQDFAKYKEKVVDTELLFDPTPAECCEIAIDQSNPRLRVLTEIATKIGLRNIRVLKQIERLVKNVESLIVGLEPGVDHQVIQSLTVFGCSWYCSKSENAIPPVEYIRKIGFSFFKAADENDNIQHATWNGWLENSGYRYTDDLDIALLESVKAGYFDEGRLLPLLRAKNEEFLAKKGADLFSEAWSLYHDTFDDNADEFVAEVTTAFTKHSKYISPSNLNGTVRFLKELGREKAASLIVDEWVEAHRSNIEAFKSENFRNFDGAIDEDVEIRIRAARESLEVPEDPLQVLLRLISSNGWNVEDEVVLAQTTPDQMYEIFKDFRDERLSKVIRKCLEFDTYNGNNERWSLIAENAKKALRRLATENELNAYRVRKFGLTLDAEEQKN